MKKQYMKPELGTKHYAQFENVFTGCRKTKHESPAKCYIDLNISSSGLNLTTGLQEGRPNEWCAHSDLSSFSW